MEKKNKEYQNDKWRHKWKQTEKRNKEIFDSKGNKICNITDMDRKTCCLIQKSVQQPNVSTAISKLFIYLCKNI